MFFNSIDCSVDASSCCHTMKYTLLHWCNVLIISLHCTDTDMVNYTFKMPLPDALQGWQDILTCPFCLDVATECIRLPHAEQDHDCGACACAVCVREWLMACNNRDITCPRCRYPLCAAHMEEITSRANPGDPLIARLVADVAAYCPHCDLTGTVASISSHNASCIGRHLTILETVDVTTRKAVERYNIVPHGDRWVNTFVSLYQLDKMQATTYLMKWLSTCQDISTEYVVYGQQWAEVEDPPPFFILSAQCCIRPLLQFIHAIASGCVGCV